MTQPCRFRLEPGAKSPVGSLNNNLSNIKIATPIFGSAKAFLDRLSGSYTDLQRSRIAETYYALKASSILAMCDKICIRLLTEADSLLNWAAVSGDAVNYGATFVPGVGFTFDGVDDYIDTGFTPVKYAIGNASIFSFLPLGIGGSGTAVMGRANGMLNRSLYPSHTSGTLAVSRVNTETSLSVSYSGSRIGLWCASEVAGQQQLHHDGTLLGESSPAISPMLNNGLNICRSAIGAHGDWAVSAWGYGAALSAAQQATLSAAIKALHAVI